VLFAATVLCSALSLTSPPVGFFGRLVQTRHTKNNPDLFSQVARGSASVYLRLHRTRDKLEKVWDHAGGVALVQAAGCIVTDCAGKPLDFASGARMKGNRGMGVLCTAGNAELHAAVVKAALRGAAGGGAAPVSKL
jgi:3'(2'), 5'-bisphosphate nucleotidase